MKRKKWTEKEEETLILEYSSLLASGALPKLPTRQKKFQPIADSLNALHHLRDPIAFPYLWSWRDISIKIQNMRHQYLNVKHKILAPASQFDWDDAVHLWPNFLRYKQVFGDLDLDLDPKASASDLDFDSEDEDDDQIGGEDGEGSQNGSCTGGEERRSRLGLGFGASRSGILARSVVEQREMAIKKREREAEKDDQVRVRDESRARWRRREERRDEEEMEWRERVMVMQMEHEKQVMQMHADVCQAQVQMSGVLVRMVCQLLGPGAVGGDGGLGGMSHQVLQSLHQHEDHSAGSLVGDDGKNDAHSGDHYI